MYNTPPPQETSKLCTTHDLHERRAKKLCTRTRHHESRGLYMAKTCTCWCTPFATLKSSLSPSRLFRFMQSCIIIPIKNGRKNKTDLLREFICYLYFISGCKARRYKLVHVMNPVSTRTSVWNTSHVCIAGPCCIDLKTLIGGGGQSGGDRSCDHSCAGSGA